MINLVTRKPLIKTNFRFVYIDVRSVVTFWFEIEAKGAQLTSEPLPAQVQQDRKLLHSPADRPFWDEDTLARLSACIARFDAANEACAAVARSFIARLDNSAELAKVLAVASATKDSRESEVADARALLESAEREMVTSDFITFFAQMVVPLKRDGSGDDRAYALYRGSVWSCSRELEPKQWSLLVDRFVEREDMELAAALAGDASSQARERISTEVRRAVWIRDQGKCARCGSRERLEYDHIVPLARGGSNTERNIELLCEACNRTKSDAIM